MKHVACALVGLVFECVYIIGQADGFWMLCWRAGAAALGAAALKDPHDVSGELLSLWAVEAHAYSAGECGLTTAAINTSAAGTQTVAAHSGASGEREGHWLTWPDGSLTFLPFLMRHRKKQYIYYWVHVRVYTYSM